MPDWLIQTLPLDPTILPPELTESTVPTWLYWTLIVLHALPGLLVGLLAGWFVMRPVNAILGWLLRGFNRAFDGLTTFYAWTIGLALRWSALVLLVYLGLVGLTCWAFTVVPTGFIPEMDQGRLIASLQLPDAEALELTKDVMARVDKITHENPGVAHTITNVGSGGGGSASNWASMYVILKPFEERRSPDRSAKAIINQLKAAWDRADPGGQSHRQRRGADPGPQPVRGFQADRRRPRRAWPESLAATDRNADGGAGPAARPEQRGHQLPPAHAATALERGPGQGRSLWRAPVGRQSDDANVPGLVGGGQLQCLRTDTGRSPSRPPGNFATTSTTSVSSRCGTTRDRWFPSAS